MNDFLVRVTKTTSRISISFTYNLPFWYYPIEIISKKWLYYQLHKPDNFELYEYLKLSFISIWDLCSTSYISYNFFLESNSPVDSYFMRQTWKILVTKRIPTMKGLSSFRRTMLIICTFLLPWKLWGFLLILLPYFNWCITSFFSIYHCSLLCPQISMLSPLI